MNYRHAYHAGNFADVLKHATLALVIEYLKRKEAPFRIIDTHAGGGRYALDSLEAAKTGEWRGGIGRFLSSDVEALPAAVARIMAPYLDAVRSENAPQGLSFYPGSPLIARRLMRAQDMLIANELHPEEWAQLRAAIGRDRRVKLMALDAWVALKALLPPKERRGIVLIDPPFEEDGELARLAEGLAQALQRFETGVYLAWYPIKNELAWYPIKNEKPLARFRDALASLTGPALLRVELMIRGSSRPDRLNGCGLIVANPPYTLQDELASVLPELTRRLGESAGARYRLDLLGPYNGGPHRSPVTCREKRSKA